MIVAHIYGGLGNQLFQYAAGRALALRLGVPLGLDLRNFGADVLHNLALQSFDVCHAEPDHVQLPPSRRGNGLRYLLWRGLRLRPRLFREKHVGYDEAFLRISDGVYLQGYWQSERYFHDYENVIRKDLRIVVPPDEANRRALDDIGATHAVSLHVRRGDYVTDTKTNAIHGTCTLDYYQRAARLIAEMSGKEPVVFAFSDDPAWVAENLTLPFEVRVVRHNDVAKNYEDLRLMSACRHHIIANSSFSWWGAWLNPDPDKIVVAPERWFADPKLCNPDIAPPGWVRM